jgi:aminopeptidase-like protein
MAHDITPPWRNGLHIHDLISRLFPICRSITGHGQLETLEILGEHLPLQIKDYPTGARCFDWEIPQEWNVTEAFIADLNGRRIIDFRQNNLHLVGYSAPFNGRVPLSELRDHLHRHPHFPDAIPYVTQYYRRDWGFCATHEQYNALTDPEYDVVVDTQLSDGILRIGEYCHPGRSDKEIWLSTYLCHPSMCNDNLSGPGVAVALMKELSELRDNFYTYRLLLLPETIGPIVYMANHPDETKRCIGGYVITCCGDRGDMTYKRTIRGDHAIDRMMERALSASGSNYNIQPYTPFGSDERQYSSPRFALPFGSLMRSSHTPLDLSNPFEPDNFLVYHSSLDDLDYIDEDCLQEVKDTYLKCMQNHESNRVYKANYFGEPFLSNHGLYVSPADDLERCLATFYFQGYADGKNSLWDIHERTGVSIDLLGEVAESFRNAGLVDLLDL